MKKYLSLFSLVVILTFSQISFAQSSVNEEGEMFEQEEKAPEEVVNEIAESENQDENAKSDNSQTENSQSENVNSGTEKSEDNNNSAENEKEQSQNQDKKDEDMAKQDAKNNPLENILVMELAYGDVVIPLRPALAPNHVARIKELTRKGFYDGIVFHRVIEGFMAQTGDPTGTGRGGSGVNLKGEFSDEAHVRGTVSMARAADPNSADSQFFIVFEEAPHLDKNYTIFGEVTEGMQLVDKIKKGFGPNGMVSEPDKMISLKVASDMDYESLPKSLIKLAEDE